jgi:amino-acid N-acetyltransferase
MLYRSIYQIYGDIRDYFVVEINKKVVGCCALHIVGKEYNPGNKEAVMAEIRSLAVLEKHQGGGIGTKLIKESISEAKKMEINKIFVLTIKENIEFFKKFGFRESKRSRLPQKIWQECVNCPRFPSGCNEILLTLEI